jgi:hypothetical protein
MSKEGETVKSPLNEIIPMNTLEKVADVQAFDLWGENIGRGDPVPLSDADGLYAYVFPYILNARQFPSHGEVFGWIRALRDRFRASTGEDSLPAAFFAELRQFGSGFGSVCVSARSTDGPILWMSHFLPPYFIRANRQKRQPAAGWGEKPGCSSTTTSHQKNRLWSLRQEIERSRSMPVFWAGACRKIY